MFSPVSRYANKGGNVKSRQLATFAFLGCLTGLVWVSLASLVEAQLEIVRYCSVTVASNPGSASLPGYYATTATSGPDAPNGPGYYGRFTSTLNFSCDQGDDPTNCYACDGCNVATGSGAVVAGPSYQKQGSCNSTTTFTTTTTIGPIPRQATWYVRCYLSPGCSTDSSMQMSYGTVGLTNNN